MLALGFPSFIQNLDVHISVITLISLLTFKLRQDLLISFRILKILATSFQFSIFNFQLSKS
jgi:hypothetical protein